MAAFAIIVTGGPAWVRRGEVRPWGHDWRHATREEAEKALALAWTIPEVTYEIGEVRS